MNASRYEQELAQTNGVLIRHWLQPEALIAEGGQSPAIEFEYTGCEDGTPGGTGERLTLACDQVFKAIGQKLEPTMLDGVARRSRSKDGPHQGRRANGAPRSPGVWAGGDCVAGGDDLTVAAVEDGKQAALSIDRVLPGDVQL